MNLGQYRASKLIQRIRGGLAIFQVNAKNLLDQFTLQITRK